MTHEVSFVCGRGHDGRGVFAIMQHFVVCVRTCFSLFQAMRTLNWKYHLGLVSLDVELADRTLSLSVSPVHAAIILHFQTKSESRGRDSALPPMSPCFPWVGGREAALLGWL